MGQGFSTNFSFLGVCIKSCVGFRIHLAMGFRSFDIRFLTLKSNYENSEEGKNNKENKNKIKFQKMLEKFKKSISPFVVLVLLFCKNDGMWRMWVGC